MPCSSMRRVSARRHDVARLQLVDEALAVRVAQQGAVAPQRLGEERPGHGLEGERGRVELDELEVGHRDAGAQGHGDAVAGGLEGVGGDGEQLAGAAGGDEDVGGPDVAHRAVAEPGGDARGSGRPRRRGRGRRRARRWPPSCAARPRRAPARPRRRWPRRRRARPGRGVCPPSRASSRSPLASRSKIAPSAISSLHPQRPLVHQHADRVLVAEPGPGVERVGEVEVGGVGVAVQHGGDAALGPAGGRLRQLALRQHADPHAVRVGGPHRGRQPGDAGARAPTGRARAGPSRPPSGPPWPGSVDRRYPPGATGHQAR